MKTYQVLIKAFAVAVVEAEDEEKATEYALDAANLGDCEMDEAFVEHELTAPQEINRAKRFANVK